MNRTRFRCRTCGVEIDLSTLEATQIDSPAVKNTDAFGETIEERPNALPPATSSSNPTSSIHQAFSSRFEVLGVLGVGGFGKVYRARDKVLNREVALKVPHEERVQDANAAKRFLREAQAAAHLAHPNIVQVYDAGQIEGNYFIASRFVAGRSLDGFLRETGPMGFGDAAKIIVKLAEAVQYAHRNGIIHRDIKPHNVMLDDQGEPHLMDFGLARFHKGDEKLTQAGSLMGTPAYMSPEQAQTSSDSEVGPHSDQYSLGAVLYELISARAPFEGPVEAVLYQVLEAEPEPLHKIRTGVPKDLETICQKAMSKDATNRYVNCAEFGKDLERWLEDRPITARPVSQIEKSVRWFKRNPLAGSLLAAVVIVSVLGFAVTSAALRNSIIQQQAAEDSAEVARINELKANGQAALAKRNENEAKKQAALLEKEKQKSEQQTELAKEQQRLAEEKAAEAQRQADLLAQEKMETERQRELARKNEQRVRTIQRSLKAEEYPRRMLYANQIRVANDAWKADQFNLANTLLNATVAESRGWEYDYLKTQLGTLFEDIGNIQDLTSIAISPRGDLLAAGNLRGIIKVWELRNGNKEKFRKPMNRIVGSVDSLWFSPDGKSLFSYGPLKAKRSAESWDVGTGRRNQIFQLTRSSSQGYITTPRKTFIRKRDRDFRGESIYRVFDIVSGKMLFEVPVQRYEAPISVSPKEQFLVLKTTPQYPTYKTTLSIIDTTTSTPRFKLESPDSLQRYGTFSVLNFSPKNSYIATYVNNQQSDAETFVNNQRSNEVQVAIRNTEIGAKQLEFTAQFSYPPIAHFSPDEKLFAYVNRKGQIIVRDIESNSILQTVLGYRAPFTRFVFSQDGRRIIATEKNGDIRFWPLVVNQTKQTMRPSRYTSLKPADGHQIAFVNGSPRRMSPSSTQMTISSENQNFTGIAKRIESGVLLRFATEGDVEVTRARGQGALNFVQATISNDGLTAIAIFTDNTLRCYETQKPAELYRLDGTKESIGFSTPIRTLRISPDGSQFTIANGNAIQIRNIQDGSLAKSLSGHAARVNSVRYSPDGKSLISGSDDATVRLWNIETGTEVLSMIGHVRGVNDVAVTPDGQRAFSASSDGTVKVWDYLTGVELMTFQSESETEFIAVGISQDGESLAALNSARVIKRWDAISQHQPSSNGSPE